MIFKNEFRYTQEFMAECEQYMYLILAEIQGSGKRVAVLEEAGDPCREKVIDKLKRGRITKSVYSISAMSGAPASQIM